MNQYRAARRIVYHLLKIKRLEALYAECTDVQRAHNILYQRIPREEEAVDGLLMCFEEGYRASE